MAKSELTGGADGRPRIHIRSYQRGFVWGLGIGPRSSQSQRYPSPGVALDAALGYLGDAETAAVVILGPVPGAPGEG